MNNKVDTYYSTDLTISIVDIKASSKAEAEAIMQRFVSRIAPIMDNVIRWDATDWTIQQNNLDESQGIWIEGGK
jgi:glutamate dehydrogenase/leucine dehydrogenase